jgi:hypothetical protein
MRAAWPQPPPLLDHSLNKEVVEIVEVVVVVEAVVKFIGLLELQLCLYLAPVLPKQSDGD